MPEFSELSDEEIKAAIQEVLPKVEKMLEEVRGAFLDGSLADRMDDPTQLQRLIQAEAIEAEACFEFDRKCGMCQWCATVAVMKAMGMLWPGDGAEVMEP